MDISVKSLLNGEKREIQLSFDIPLEYSENGYDINDPLKVSGEIKDMGGYILLNATCTAHYKTRCARCLEPLDGECQITFERPVATRLVEEDTEEEYILVGGNSSINIDEPVSEELLLSLPFRSLCSEDCKGLCPKCGCNKNRTECSCVTKEIDPRLAVLKNFKPKE